MDSRKSRQKGQKTLNRIMKKHQNTGSNTMYFYCNTYIMR